MPAQTSKGVLGAGTVLEYGIPGTGETFNALVEPSSITPPNPKWTYQPTTNLASPAVGVGVLKEQIPSEYDPGTMSATLLFTTANEAGRQALLTAFNAGTILDYKMILPGAGTDATMSFSGYVSEMAYENISPEKVISYKFTATLTTTVTES